MDDKKKKPKPPVPETIDHVLLEMRNNTDAVKSLEKTMEVVVLVLKEISKKIDMLK